MRKRKITFILLFVLIFTMFFPSTVFSSKTPDKFPTDMTLKYGNYLNFDSNTKYKDYAAPININAIEKGCDYLYFQAIKHDPHCNHHNLNYIFICRVEYGKRLVDKQIEEIPEFMVKRLTTKRIKLKYNGTPLSDQVVVTVYEVNEKNETEITRNFIHLRDLYNQLPGWQRDKIHQVTSYLSRIPDKPITPYDLDMYDKLKLLADMFLSATLCKYLSKVFDRLLIEPGFGPDFISTILLSNINELKDRAESYFSGEKSGGSFGLNHRVAEMNIEKGKAIWGNYFQSVRALPIENFTSKTAQSEMT